VAVAFSFTSSHLVLGVRAWMNVPGPAILSELPRTAAAWTVPPKVNLNLPAADCSLNEPPRPTDADDCKAGQKPLSTILASFETGAWPPRSKLVSRLLCLSRTVLVRLFRLATCRKFPIIGRMPAHRQSPVANEDFSMARSQSSFRLPAGPPEPVLQAAERDFQPDPPQCSAPARRIASQAGWIVFAHRRG